MDSHRLFHLFCFPHLGQLGPDGLPVVGAKRLAGNAKLDFHRSTVLDWDAALHPVAESLRSYRQTVGADFEALGLHGLLECLHTPYFTPCEHQCQHVVKR